MALLNEKEEYIKLSPNGLYIVYKSKEDRENYKNSLKPLKVLKMYEEILKEKYSILYDYSVELGITDEDYMDRDKYQSILDANPEYKKIVEDYYAWNKESCDFHNDLYTGKPIHESFPLLSEKLGINIIYSIPKIKESGQLCSLTFIDNVDDMYAECKEKRIFGDTKDC